MNHGSLFSGIGGFDLAAEWMGWENVFQVEKDEWLRKLLAQNFPNAKQYNDVKTFDGKEYSNTIDIISGGFPCQPFSVAGKRNGTSDDRYLWPEFIRIVREVKPACVVGENVTGLLTMENGKTFERIWLDLENAGYTPEVYNIPAASVGAWHKRERLWIVAYTNNYTDRIEPQTNRKTHGIQKVGKPVLYRGYFAGTGNEPNSYANCFELAGGGENRSYRPKHQGIGITTFNDHENWEDLPEPTISGGHNGVPDRVDRTKSLGNAIVPQVAYEIFKAIEKAKLINTKHEKI